MDERIEKSKKDVKIEFINLLDELYGKRSCGMWYGVQRDLSIPACN